MPIVPDILATIVQHKRKRVAQQKIQVPLAILKEQAAATPTRGFISAIKTKLAANDIAIIAEIKQASPSKGIIAKNFLPAKIAASYEQHGATCLSVLTDVDFFHGSNSDLQQAHNACTLPVLRKDFMIDSYQIYEAKNIGADCILLIAAILTDAELNEFTILAQQLNMDVLIEVHDLIELERALKINTPLIGINNRNLRNFTTDLQTTLQLLSHIPADKIIVTESGIKTRDDIKLMRANGVNVFLIGETFMQYEDPGVKLAELLA